MKKIGVIGCGRVGRVIASELSQDSACEVMVCDTSKESLDSLKIVPDDKKQHLKDPGSELSSFLSQQEIVINCTPGHIGYRTLEQVIDAKKHCVDISFFAEEPSDLHDKAKQAGVEIWFDMGLAPGMSNIIGAHLAEKHPNCDSIDLFVGGLPVERTFPYEYKAVFSPSDVIEEYTRPSRIRREGAIHTVPALSEPELVDIPGVGTLEGFVTDGLRSLLHSVTTPNMREMTLRYPGHREFMLRLREGGFFSEEPLAQFGNTSPRQVVEEVLKEGWKLGDGDKDCTVFLATARNTQSTEEHRVHLVDYRDMKTGYTSMARTTGFVAAAATSYLAQHGSIKGPGVHAPEVIISDKSAFDHLLQYLSQRDVTYTGVP